LALVVAHFHLLGGKSLEEDRSLKKDRSLHLEDKVRFHCAQAKLNSASLHTDKAHPCCELGWNRSDTGVDIALELHPCQALFVVEIDRDSGSNELPTHLVFHKLCYTLVRGSDIREGVSAASNVF
jgi:hypothetical protein